MESRLLEHPTGTQQIQPPRSDWLQNPKAGELILLKEKGMSRGSWRIAKITEVHKSSDGAIRSCDIQLPSGKVVRRPVGMLIPLEANLTDDKEPEGFPDQPSYTPHPINPDLEKPSPPKTVQTLDSPKKQNWDEKLILAKVKGYPTWPALQLASIKGAPLETMENKMKSIPVKFFKTQRLAFAPPTGIIPFSELETNDIKIPNLQAAYKMAREWEDPPRETKSNNGDRRHTTSTKPILPPGVRAL